MNLSESWLRSGAFSMHEVTSGIKRETEAVCSHFEFPFCVLAAMPMLPFMLLAATNAFKGGKRDPHGKMLSL